MFLTQVYGRNIQSDIELPGLSPTEGGNNRERNTSPITLACANVALPEQSKREYLSASNGVFRASDQEQCLFGTVPQLGHFKLTPNSVTLAPQPNLSNEHLISFALGSGLGLQLYLQNIIPMHGMAFMNTDGTASLVFGMSGAGKSTLAAACASAGVPIFSDDILPIERIGDEVYIYPAHRRLKVSSELGSELNLKFANNSANSSHIEPAYPGTNKIGWLAPQSSFSQTPARISKCYVLRKIRSNENGNILPPMHPTLAMQTLRRYVYRPKLVSFMELNRAFFEQAHLISKQTQCSYLQLPEKENYSSFQAYAQHAINLMNTSFIR